MKGADTKYRTLTLSITTAGTWMHLVMFNDPIYLTAQGQGTLEKMAWKHIPHSISATIEQEENKHPIVTEKGKLYPFTPGENLWNSVMNWRNQEIFYKICFIFWVSFYFLFYTINSLKRCGCVLNHQFCHTELEWIALHKGCFGGCFEHHSEIHHQLWSISWRKILCLVLKTTPRL